MNYIYTPVELYANNDKGQKVVSIKIPIYKDGSVNITSVFVDETLRGQGIASDAMTALYNHLKQNNLKAFATCPYAVVWFKRNQQYQDILVGSK